jgi:hypothetical protein
VACRPRVPSHYPGVQELSSEEAQSIEDGAVCAETPKPRQQPISNIFSNEFFEVKRSGLGGWGAFATIKLKCGDHILFEKPLLNADQNSLYKDYDRLDVESQAVVMSLHAFYQKDQLPKLMAVWRTNAYVYPPCLCLDEVLHGVALRFRCELDFAMVHVEDNGLWISRWTAPFISIC